MPIHQFLRENGSFEPDDLRVMGSALTAALAKLGLNDRSDALVETVARRIIRAALAGERDVTALTDIGTDGAHPFEPRRGSDGPVTHPIPRHTPSPRGEPSRDR